MTSLVKLLGFFNYQPLQQLQSKLSNCSQRLRAALRGADQSRGHTDRRTNVCLYAAQPGWAVVQQRQQHSISGQLNDRPSGRFIRTRMASDFTAIADKKQVPAINCLDDLIQQLRLVFQSDCVNVEYVRALLAAYKSNPKDWKQYAIFDPHRYTRNLVDSGNERFNLMVLCWGEGHGSSVHDHSDAHCFVKVLDGQLKETMFAWPSTSKSADGTNTNTDELQHEALRQTAVHCYDKNGVTYINDSMGLHRIENPSHTSPTVSLHLYSPPFMTCQTFDQRTGVARKIKMKFWSEYGHRTPSANVNGAQQACEVRQKVREGSMDGSAVVSVATAK